MSENHVCFEDVKQVPDCLGITDCGESRFVIKVTKHILYNKKIGENRSEVAEIQDGEAIYFADTLHFLRYIEDEYLNIYKKPLEEMEKAFVMDSIDCQWLEFNHPYKKGSDIVAIRYYLHPCSLLDVLAVDIRDNRWAVKESDHAFANDAILDVLCAIN